MSVVWARSTGLFAQQMLPALADVLRKARVPIAVLSIPAAHARPRDAAAHVAAHVAASAYTEPNNNGVRPIAFEPLSVLGCDALVRSITLRFMHFGDAEPAPVHAVCVDTVAPSSDGARAVRMRTPSHGAHLPVRRSAQSSAAAASAVPRDGEQRTASVELEYEAEQSGAEEAEAAPCMRGDGGGGGGGARDVFERAVVHVTPTVTKSGRTVKHKPPKLFELGSGQAKLSHGTACSAPSTAERSIRRTRRVGCTRAASRDTT